jgi:hypothetical protein
MGALIIMSETDLNCYITQLFLENTTLPNSDFCDKNGIKATIFESLNMALIKKTQSYSKDRHDKLIFTLNPLKPIVSFSNAIIFDNGTIENIAKSNWNDIEIIEYNFNSLHVVLFNENFIWYISCHDEIIRLDNINNSYVKIFNDLLHTENVKNWVECEGNSEIVYHLLLVHPMLCKVTQHDIKSITLLWTCDKHVNIINSNVPYLSKKLKYFSCLDELQISLETECNNDMLNKSLSFGGYFLKIPYSYNNRRQYICCVIRSNLYKYILSVLPKNENKYISYLELYQRNELSDVITYIHKYPNDVIRRINMAIRTLSKEILNIYHLTRKKQNFILYNSLTKRYKKVLFELHKIYVTQKHKELNTKHSKTEILLIEKKSISVDVVYDYLKLINVNDLIQIFKDRNEIINILTNEKYKLDNIFNLNDIYIVTQIELMFNKL